ncbi:hypothetical protein F5Y14DRAFT_224613 [Nemania sp. NC0429]|nr:hypothetical protein F5Y14DRAFT_224613 [Nemania sp. NC0429]
MLVNTISELFYCGHTQTTPDFSAPVNPRTRSYETLKDLVADSTPLPNLCLTCTCTQVLSISDPRMVPRSSIRDLNAHVNLLERRASSNMRRELRSLADQIRRTYAAHNSLKFHRAVIALAGYLEVCAWFSP